MNMEVRLGRPTSLELKSWANKYGFTSSELSSTIGINKSTVQKWLNGQKEPKVFWFQLLRLETVMENDKILKAVNMI